MREKDYEDMVKDRMDKLRIEYPDGDYPDPMPEHLGDECLECDSLRRLLNESSQRDCT
jgi:hypothetical protein